MINENIVDFAYLQSLFFLFLCFLFSASSLKTSFFCCFNSYYLLSRTKFGIRAWLLIVLTIKRSICLCLTLDWSKKKRTVLIKKKKIVHRHCSSSTTTIFSSGASANHSGRPIIEKTCTSVPQSDRQFYINADHSQRSQPRHKYTPIYCLQQPATLQPQQVFVFSNPNQCYKPSAVTTTDLHPPAAAPVATPPSTVPSPSAATTDQQAPV